VAGKAILRAFRDFRISRERILRISMTSETVSHPHGHILIYNLHRLNFAMTGLAQDPRMDMRPMVKINMVGQ
jgi:hypothetical protein